MSSQLDKSAEEPGCAARLTDLEMIKLIEEGNNDLSCTIPFLDFFRLADTAESMAVGH